MTVAGIISPLDLYDYQIDWINDQRQFKCWEKSRQIGASFIAGLEMVLDCVMHPGTTWIVLSTGARAAKEFIYSNVAKHAHAINLILNGKAEYSKYRDSKASCSDYNDSINEIDVRISEARFPNRSRIMAIPANPDTARGLSGNICLDEFAFHRDPKKIWAGVFPILSRGFKMRVISTHNGDEGMYHDIVRGTDKIWSRHFTDIHQAVAAGMPADVKALEEAVADDDIWGEEFLCIPMSSAQQFISQEIITACESDDASLDLPPGFAPHGSCYLGMDLARKRHHTVIALTEKILDVAVVRSVYRMQNIEFAAQATVLEDYMSNPKLARACLDATGLGMEFSENAVKKYGDHRVEGVMFTAQSKEMLAHILRKSLEERLIRIPKDRDLRQDLRSLKRFTTATGNFRFDADASSRGSHADGAWALALALQAATVVEDYSTGVLPTGAAAINKQDASHGRRRGMRYAA